MAKGFNLTAQINLAGPTNLKPVIAAIKRELGTIQSNVQVKLDARSTKSISSVTSRLKAMNDILVTAKSTTDSLNTSLAMLSSSLASVSNNGGKVSVSIKNTASGAAEATKNIKQASTEMQEFGKQAYLAIRRFAAFSIVSTTVFKLVNAVHSGIAAFVNFDKELIKLQQVTGESATGLKSLEKTITQLSTSLGVSSESLINVASTLAQAGLNAEETRIALTALAKTELAPSFDNLTDTTEGAIAALKQFELQAGELESVLGSINAVAAAFAVESKDIITAIQRTGGVFAAASKGVSQGKDSLNEFIAVFTSVRQTTRESAETIATGLRTIFTRIQRGSTIQTLKDFGITLTDLEGKFVGPFEAIKRLSEGLKSLDPRDLRFSQIVEELGGFRQIGKVIPLIQQFAVAQKALGIAQTGQTSLTDAQIIAQQSLANQIAKVREQFLALFRDIGQSKTFQVITKGILGLTSAFLSLASAFKPILPVLTVLATIKGVKALGEFSTGFLGGFKKSGGARAAGSNIGGIITGTSEKEKSDITGKASETIRDNTSAIKSLTTAINSLASIISSRSTGLNNGGIVGKFASGGLVPGSGNTDTYRAMLTPGEFVIRKKAVEAIGVKNLAAMNRGGEAQRFANGRGVKGRRGSRSRLKELSSEEISQLSTKDILKYGKRLARDIFTTSGAGMAIGNEFIEVPASRIIAELEGNLTTHMGKKGYWREKISPFGRPSKAQKSLSSRYDRENSLEKQIARHADEVAARSQQWNNISSGSAIDNYLLSSLTDPVLSDYKMVRGGKSLSKQFHNTRLRQAVNKALDNYDDFDYSPKNIDKLISNFASKQFNNGGLIQKFVEGGEIEKQILENTIQTNKKGKTRYRFGLVGLRSGTKERQSRKESFSINTNGFNRGVDLYIGTLSEAINDTFSTDIEENITSSLKSIISDTSKKLKEQLGSQNITTEQTQQVLQGSALSSAVGNIFESSLNLLGSPYLEKTEKTKAIDFPFGLGTIGNKFGIPSNIPTDATRTVGGAGKGLSNMKGQIIRFLKAIDRGEFTKASNKLAGKISMAQVNQTDMLPTILSNIPNGFNASESGRKLKEKYGLRQRGALNPKSLSKTLRFLSEQGQEKQFLVDLQSEIGLSPKLEVLRQQKGGLIKQFAFGGTVDQPNFEDIRKKIIDQYPDIDFRISKRKRGFGYNILGALKSDGGLLKSKGLKFEQPSNLQKLISSSENIVKNLTNPTRAGFSTGGSSEDTVNALLTPGEFVINKKAAKRIGYNRLNRMNKADKLQGFNKGGVVGNIQKFAGGGLTKDEQDFLDYRARQANTSTKAFTYDISGDIARTATGLQRDYSGRKQEFKYSMTQEREKLKGLDLKTVGGQNAFAEAVAEMAKKVQSFNPEMTFDEAKKAAEQLAKGLLNGKKSNDELIQENTTLKNIMDKELTATEALTQARIQVAKQQNIEVGILDKAIDPNEIKRQQFIQSEEGKRFGNLSLLAPDSIKKFSEGTTGGALMKGSDFLAGKGGRLSKLVGGMGGIGGIGAALAVGSEGLKSLLPKSMISNPNIAGVFGAISGVGAGAATGAVLGAQIAGPIGAMVAGIGGAVIGGVQGFFNSKNTQILTNALESVAKSSSALDTAFKKLEADTNNVNFQATQKAFGDVMSSQKDIIDLSMAQTATLTGAATSSAALAGAGAGALIGSFFGPGIGTAIGSGVGYLGGATLDYLRKPSESVRKEGMQSRIAQASSNQQIASKLAETQLKRTSTAELDKIFKSLKDGTASLDPITRQYVDSTLKSAEATGKYTKVQLDSIAASAEDETYRQAYIKSLKESGASNDEVQRQLTENNDKVIAEGKKIVQANALLISKQEILARITKEVAVATENLLDVYERISSALTRFSSNTDSIIANLDNIINPTKIAKINRNKTEEAILSNPLGFKPEEVTNAIDSMVNKLGGGKKAIELGQQAKAASVLQTQLPALMRSPGATTEQVTNLARSQLTTILGEKNPIIGTIMGELENKLGQDKQGGLATLANEIESSGLGQISTTAAKAFETLKESAKTYNDTFDKSIELENQWVQSMSNMVESNRKANQIRVQSELDLRRTLGQQISLQDLNQPFESDIRGLTRGPIDVTGIAAQRQQALDEGKRLQTERENLIANQASQDELNKNSEALRKNKLRIDNLDKALSALGNSADRANNSLTKIGDRQQRVQEFGQGFRGLFTGGVENRIEAIRQFRAVSAGRQALASGQTGIFDNQMFLQSFEQGLDRLKGIMDPRIYQDLILKSNIAMAEQAGFNVNEVMQGLEDTFGSQYNTLRKVFELQAGKAAEGDPLIIEFKKYAEEQRKANIETARQQAEISSILTKEGINPLIKSLEENFPRIVQDAFDSARNNIQSAVQAAGNPQNTVAADEFASGGIVYANSGGQLVNFKPKGPDKIPAMLADGEFVVNAKATKNNLSLLEAINGGKKIIQNRYANRGGVIYAAGGGMVSGLTTETDKIPLTPYQARQKQRSEAYLAEKKQRQKTYNQQQQQKREDFAKRTGRPTSVRTTRSQLTAEQRDELRRANLYGRNQKTGKPNTPEEYNQQQIDAKLSRGKNLAEQIGWRINYIGESVDETNASRLESGLTNKEREELLAYQEYARTARNKENDIINQRLLAERIFQANLDVSASASAAGQEARRQQAIQLEEKATRDVQYTKELQKQKDANETEFQLRLANRKKIRLAQDKQQNLDFDTSFTQRQTSRLAQQQKKQDEATKIEESKIPNIKLDPISLRPISYDFDRATLVAQIAELEKKLAIKKRYGENATLGTMTQKQIEDKLYSPLTGLTYILKGLDKATQQALESKVSQNKTTDSRYKELQQLSRQRKLKPGKELDEYIELSLNRGIPYGKIKALPGNIATIEDRIRSESFTPQEAQKWEERRKKEFDKGLAQEKTTSFYSKIANEISDSLRTGTVQGLNSLDKYLGVEPKPGEPNANEWIGNAVGFVSSVPLAIANPENVVTASTTGPISEILAGTAGASMALSQGDQQDVSQALSQTTTMLAMTGASRIIQGPKSKRFTSISPSQSFSPAPTRTIKINGTNIPVPNYVPIGKESDWVEAMRYQGKDMQMGTEFEAGLRQQDTAAQLLEDKKALSLLEDIEKENISTPLNKTEPSWPTNPYWSDIARGSRSSSAQGINIEGTDLDIPQKFNFDDPEGIELDEEIPTIIMGGPTTAAKVRASTPSPKVSVQRARGLEALPPTITDISDPKQFDDAIDYTVSRLAKYASSPETATKMISELPDKLKAGIADVRVVPDLGSVKRVRNESGIMESRVTRGSYSSGTRTIKYPTKTPSLAHIKHEIGHGIQDLAGNQYTTKGLESIKENLGSDFDDFLTNPSGLKKLYADLGGSGGRYTSSDIAKKPRELFTTLLELEDTDAFRNNEMANKIMRKLIQSIGYKNGGLVHAATGGKIGSGPDSILARVSPNEFIMNPEDTMKNLPLLHYMNRGGKISYFQDGGQTTSSGNAIRSTGPNGNMVVTQNSNVASNENMPDFTKFIDSFGTYVDRLEKIQFPKIPDRIELTGNYQLQVQIQGAAALEGLDKRMKELAVSLIEPKLEELRNEVSSVTGGQVKSSAARGYKGDVNISKNISGLG